jgi:hypothetical protein
MTTGFATPSTAIFSPCLLGTGRVRAFQLRVLRKGLLTQFGQPLVLASCG